MIAKTTTPAALKLSAVRTEQGNSLTFELRSGEAAFIAVHDDSVRENLIMQILGLEKSEGLVHAGDLCAQSNSYEFRKKVGFVPATRIWNNKFTVAEAIELHSSFYDSWNNSKVQQILSAFSVETKSRVSDLTKSEALYLAIALSVGHDPEVVILDEPYRHIDEKNCEAIAGCLCGLRQDGMVILSAGRANPVATSVGGYYYWLSMRRGLTKVFSAVDTLKHVTFSNSDIAGNITKGLLPVDVEKKIYAVLYDDAELFIQENYPDIQYVEKQVDSAVILKELAKYGL